jgi:hypothetical protein
MWLVVIAAVLLMLRWRGLPLAYHLRVLGRVLYARLLLPRPAAWSDETVLSFRAWRDDLDWDMHLDNSSYNKRPGPHRAPRALLHRQRERSQRTVLMRFKRSIRWRPLSCARACWEPASFRAR